MRTVSQATKWALLWLGLALLAGAFLACASDDDGTAPGSGEGTFTGTVTVGPLCPVEPCTDPVGDTYSSRQLRFERDGYEPILVPLQADGSFASSVPVGSYLVYLTDCEFLGCFDSLPVAVDIRENEAATLRIDIDTGIRAPVGLPPHLALAEELRSARATVEIGDPVDQPFFNGSGIVLKVNGADVQVFEYPKPEEADREASLVGPDGSSVGTTTVMWVALPHFYGSGSLIALYVGGDESLMTLLEGVLGPQFAGHEIESAEAGNLSEERFGTLLTLEDVTALLSSPLELKAEVRDFKQLAAQVNPAQVERIDSWFGLTLETDGGTAGLTFTVIDFDTEQAALGHYDLVTAWPSPLNDMAVPIGSASAQADVNAEGIGSMVVALTGDVFLEIHTAPLEGREPVLPLSGLESLAALAVGRLSAQSSSQEPSCQQRLALFVTIAEQAGQAVATSYQCGSLYVDSTGRYPETARSLTAPTGAILDIGFDPFVRELPTTIELRLYPQAGVYGSFGQWPEGLPGGPQPVDSVTFEPALSFDYRVGVQAGEYALVARVTWDGQVDVFYAIAFRLE